MTNMHNNKKDSCGGEHIRQTQVQPLLKNVKKKNTKSSTTEKMFVRCRNLDSNNFFFFKTLCFKNLPRINKAY